jgi:hypothetical protein
MQRQLGAGASLLGYLDNTTSYTDFTLTPSSGTLTGGTIRVYGYTELRNDMATATAKPNIQIDDDLVRPMTTEEHTAYKAMQASKPQSASRSRSKSGSA